MTLAARARMVDADALSTPARVNALATETHHLAWESTHNEWVAADIAPELEGPASPNPPHPRLSNTTCPRHAPESLGTEN